MLYDKIEIYKKLTQIDGKFDFDNFMKSLKWVSNGFILAGKIANNHAGKLDTLKVVEGYNHKSNDISILRFSKAVVSNSAIDEEKYEYLYDELYNEVAVTKI
mgnify:CR=1 FL=1